MDITGINYKMHCKLISGVLKKLLSVIFSVGKMNAGGCILENEPEPKKLTSCWLVAIRVNLKFENGDS